MQYDRFKRLCDKAGVSEVARKDTPEGTILVGERYRNIADEYAKPCWEVLWFVRRDKADVGRRLYFDFGSSSRPERVNAAIADAMQFMKDNKHVGRYDR
jgi:hypothetical protein